MSRISDKLCNNDDVRIERLKIIKKKKNDDDS